MSERLSTLLHMSHIKLSVCEINSNQEDVEDSICRRSLCARDWHEKIGVLLFALVRVPLTSQQRAKLIESSC